MRIVLILFLSLISFEIKSFEKKESFCDFNINEYIHELRNSNYVEEINVNVNDYKKWTINNLRILTDFRENIRTEYKNRFKAKVTVKYIFGKCVYKARIRQHGDWKDHINYNKNNVHIDQSINVRLSEGNILGITEFILFLPHTRNGNNEILTTLLLNEFNILAPRSFLFKTNINGNTSKMLFQEKIRKEFLEINNRKEGPILEGDEELIWSYGVDTDDTKFKEFESVSLGRLNNVNWSSRNKTNILNSQKALTKLQEIYLLYASSMIINEHNLILNYDLLSNYNESLKDQWLIFDILLMSLTAEHAMRPHNRKFYWSVLYDGFEPIYYDGNSRIINICKSEIIDPNLMSFGDYDIKIINNFINDDIFLKIQNKLEKLKNNQNFINKINLKMNISKKILVDKINIVLKNNKCLKNYFDKQEKINLNINNKEKTKKSLYSRLDSLKVNYLTIDNLLNNNNLKNFDNFLSCNDNNSCIFTNKNNNELIANILSHKHKINNKFIFYIEDKQIDTSKIFNLKKINNLNINLYHTNDAEIIYDNKNRKIIINQLNNTSRVIFFNGILENIEIEFNGIEKTNLTENNNIELKNSFTGCITFENVEFKNVNIVSKEGKCEDSINVINSSGEINSIKSYNAFSDAIDFDFSNILIKKIIVEGAINDCVDLSYGKYEINYMNLDVCGDKALSIGESSKLINEIVKISNSNYGISTKDSSFSDFNLVEIENVNTCISSYNKKQEFDGAISKINNIKCNNFQLAYYYDDMSKIQIISEELSKGPRSK